MSKAFSYGFFLIFFYFLFLPLYPTTSPQFREVRWSYGENPGLVLFALYPNRGCVSSVVPGRLGRFCPRLSLSSWNLVQFFPSWCRVQTGHIEFGFCALGGTAFAHRWCVRRAWVCDLSRRIAARSPRPHVEVSGSRASPSCPAEEGRGLYCVLPLGGSRSRAPPIFIPPFGSWRCESELPGFCGKPGIFTSLRWLVFVCDNP